MSQSKALPGAGTATIAMLPTKDKLLHFNGYLWLTLGMFVVVIATFTAYVRAEKNIDRANEIRHQSLLLAHELRQSSDDLTRMVRTYVATGESSYKQHYQEILDIRDGRLPRPLDYQNIYWDLVMADDHRPRPNGAAVPLLQLMQQAGFTAEEFAKLNEAKANSDALTQTEFAAMKLIESPWPPSESSRHKAIGLLHDQAYHQAKARIMEPIDQFYQMANKRTLAAVQNAETIALEMRLAFGLTGVMLILLALSVRRHQRRLLGGSLDDVYAGIARLGKGDLTMSIHPDQGMTDSVLGWLAETHGKLAQLDAERSQAAREQKKLIRALRLLSDCNLALVSAREEQGLLEDVCRLIVETGGYRMAWIGFAEHDEEKNIRTVAQFGNGAQDYLASIRKSWDETLSIGRGPTGTAFRTGKIQVNQDYQSNPVMVPWSQQAQQHGYQSSIALPLQVAGKTIGTLTLYAAEPNAFYPEEISLLDELARNIGFGMETLRTREQRETAEAASRAKSQFLANMSHELRTPMNAIMGMTAMALRHADTLKLRDQLTKISQASQHLLNVINDILDFSKIEAGRMSLECVCFTFGQVMENLISLVGQRAAEKQLSLQVDLPSGLTQQNLFGDSLRLGQVLLNLTSNAIKFTDQGSITVRARVDTDGPHELLLRFEIQDTGIGISAADQERLFTAFEQADGSMTRRYGGTGLGLAISKRLVQLMGGEIGVYSAPGQGSTFWFTLRLEKVAAGSAIPPAPSFAAMDNSPAETRLKTEFSGIHLLLAEDEPINQEVSCGLLEDIGLRVDLAEDGARAVEMAGQRQYDLILMDMQMPVLNGVEATRTIRTLPGYASTPILAMTANAFDEDRQTCLAAGMNDHIGKPVVPELLYETMVYWLEKTRNRSSSNP